MPWMPESSMGDPRIVTVGAPMLPDATRMSNLLAEAVQTGWLTNAGPLHQRLEDKIARLLGVGQVGLVASGTMALMIALRLGRLPEGAEIVTSPLSFPATVQAIRWCGFRPVFADIDPDGLTICPKAVEAAITPATAAILPVHFLGAPCDVGSLQDIARRHGLWLTYDAAHAFGQTVDGVPIAGFGDASAFSLHATKLLHTGEGGAVALPGASDLRDLSRTRNFGLHKGRMDGIGTNGKLSEAQAAMGLALLPDLPAEIARRQALRAQYDQIFQDIDGIDIHRMPSCAQDSLLYYTLRMRPGLRERLYMALAQARIFARDHFPVLCGPGTDLPDAGIVTAGGSAVAPMVAPQLLCLPFHGRVTPEDVARIESVVRHCIRQKET